MIDYSPLWETMKRKDVTQYKLLKNKVIDNKALDTLRKNKNITMLTLEKLCHALDCTPNDIVKFPTDEQLACGGSGFLPPKLKHARYGSLNFGTNPHSGR